MRDLFATRADWLLRVSALGPGDILTITQLDGLTGDMAVKAMVAQGLIGRDKPRYVFHDHGTVVHIQREKTP